jgi:hypothetical protein
MNTEPHSGYSEIDGVTIMPLLLVANAERRFESKDEMDENLMK